MKEIQQYYLSEGLEVEPLMQEDIHHYCLVHVNSSEMRIQTFGVTPDAVEHPVLLEEVIIPKPEIEHAAGSTIGAYRGPAAYSRTGGYSFLSPMQRRKNNGKPLDKEV
jgi:hypothetical protein